MDASKVLEQYYPEDAPIERPVSVPEELIARFISDKPPVVERSDTDGPPMSKRFDCLDQEIEWDVSNLVPNPRALIERFNDYEYTGSSIGAICGCVMTVASFGTFLLGRRHIVQPDQFGLILSSGRYLLLTPGIHTLRSTTEKWRGTIPIDDENNPVRYYGAKIIVYVPENAVAGGFRIDRSHVPGEGSENASGDFVLFPQGFHVLDQSRYQQVEMKKLDANIVKLGPVTVLYVRDGHLGGAYHKTLGSYKVFYPGRPLILHEKNFVDISHVQVSTRRFVLGPLEYVTVPEGGYIGGAFRKKGGTFQILPPNNTYCLHSKDFDRAEVAQRCDLFELGPYFVVTVRKGYLVGAFTRHTGEFTLLPEDFTYWLQKDEYHKPEVVKIEGHVTKCGPLTLLTLEEGVLGGSYRVSDGQFVEFDDPDEKYLLHEKDYHGLVRVNKYSSIAQNFGPYKVITIREGFCGVFENKGAIEIIMKPGFYQVRAEYKIREPMSLQIFNEMLEEVFKTKDGISMRVRGTLTWRVNEPGLVAKRAGDFNDLQQQICHRAIGILVRLCRQNNRGQLLPTQEDMMSRIEKGKSSSDDGIVIDVELDKLQKEIAETTKELYTNLRKECINALNEASVASGFGVEIKAVHISGFELLDKSIMDDLSESTRARIAAKTAIVKGEQAIAEAEARKRTCQKQAESEAHIQKVRARAEGDVLQTRAEAEAKARVAAARAENEAGVLMETAKARADAEARAIKLDIETRQVREKAQAEAEAIRVLAEANYEKEMKEHDAASKMPSQQFDILMAHEAVSALKNFGTAAWKHPYEMTDMVRKFLPLLRVGPMSLADAFKNLDTNEKDKNVVMPK